MTDPASALPALDETADILRFLRRFADLMSTGSNSDNLARAAEILETQSDLLKASREIFETERIKGDAAAEACKALEVRIGELENEILMSKAKLTEQQSNAREILAEMEKKQAELLRRAEQAEAELGAFEQAPPAIPFGSIAAPLSSLQLARGQFQSLAQAFEKSGNVVSQVMCEASASNLDRVIVNAGVSDDADDRSQHAA